MTSTILVPVDGSDKDACALAVAADLALDERVRERGATVGARIVEARTGRCDRPEELLAPC